MGFLGVYKAVYDYEPQAEGELEIKEGDTLYVLEKSADDDWWKAKKKAAAEDEDEPTGLIPNNYIEEVEPEGHARALYEYTRQTDEELSFPEDARLAVYDTTDPDWVLVGLDGEFGFVPANYIDQDGAGAAGEEEAAEPETPPPSLPARTTGPAAPANPTLPPRNAPPEPASPVASGPAAALAGVLAGRSASSHTAPAPLALPPRPSYTSEGSEDEALSPPLPNRPRSQSIEERYQSPTTERDPRQGEQDAPTSLFTPGGFHMYNINEMVSVMGKRKKMPTTLGINLKTGTILIAPERAQDGPSQEWTADRMSHYSREGKHVFLELVRPSKSVDFHAGAKDTAEEIVAALGEMAGAFRAEGLREVIEAGTGGQGQKTGQVLYDFMAQGEDEVTVAAGDEVLVLDDRNEEWWQVRRLKNGKEGVMPGSYVEVTGTVAAASGPAVAIPPPAHTSRSTVEQNRLEEARLTREALKAAQREEEKERKVGPGINLPERTSSLSARDSGNKAGQQRSTRENGSSSRSKSKPDLSKVRVWKDRSNSFSVEAQFIGLKDGKINLHKVNGVKIAVPIAKMSLVDIEWVEQATGLSLDEEKPLSEVRKKAQAEASRTSGGSSNGRRGDESSSRVGASVEQPQKPEYDWFGFFLACDVAVGLCERYAQAFNKDSMDESVLPDVDASVLRNLGLREGDIIKVMRYLDNKYGRTKKGEGDGDAGGGLFSGPGGTLRNNTRKGRPAPAVQTNDVVDAKAFSQQKDSSPDGRSPPSLSSSAAADGNRSRQAAATSSSGGFDDDAWNVKPRRQQSPEPASSGGAAAATRATRASEPAPASAPVPAAKPLSQNMQELSLLTQPLQPTRAETAAIAPLGAAPQAAVATPAAAAAAAAAPLAPPQPTGATPGFFTTLAQQQTGMQQPQMALNGQQTGVVARQRPLPPQFTAGQGALVPPPPSRPLSAPQSAQPSAFAPPPLQPQMTGLPYPTQQQIAPPGQSLNDITQARMQQQYLQSMQQQQQQQQMAQQQLQSAPMGFAPQPTGMLPFQTGMQPQPTGFAPNLNQYGGGQAMMQNGGVSMQSPFADPIRPTQFSPVQAQPTGFPGQFGGNQGFGASGLNNYLPQALEPQRTAAPSMASLPPMPPMPTGFGQSIAPLQPQKTGPPPPVRFGVKPEANKLMVQPTGRRANLASATPQNPFGF